MAYRRSTRRTRPPNRFSFEEFDPEERDLADDEWASDVDEDGDVDDGDGSDDEYVIDDGFLVPDDEEIVVAEEDEDEGSVDFTDTDDDDDDDDATHELIMKEDERLQIIEKTLAEAALPPPLNLTALAAPLNHINAPTKSVLVATAKAYGIPHTGTKGVLIRRINAQITLTDTRPPAGCRDSVTRVV